MSSSFDKMLQELHSQFPELQEGNVLDSLKTAGSNLWGNVKQAMQGSYKPEAPQALPSSTPTTPAPVAPPSTDFQSVFAQHAAAPTGFEDIEHLAIAPVKTIASILVALMNFAGAALTESSLEKFFGPLYEATPPNPDIVKLKAIIKNTLTGKTAEQISKDLTLISTIQKIIQAAEKAGIRIPGLPKNATQSLDAIAKQVQGPSTLDTPEDLKKALDRNPTGAQNFVQTIQRAPKNGPVGQAVTTLLQQ